MVTTHDETFENPYRHQILASDEGVPFVSPDQPVLPPCTLRVVIGSLLTWSTVCAVGAIPSFLLATNVVNHPWAWSIMTAGVVCFAGFCVAVHLTWGRSFFAQRPRLRRAVHASYALRFLQTAAIPIGWIVDSTCGMLAVSVVSELGGEIAQAPALIFITVLLQGCLLNIFLFGLVPLNFAVIILFSRTRQ